MSIISSLSYTRDLSEPLISRELRDTLIQGDQRAHKITVTVTDGGTALPLTGATVTAYMIRGDQVTVLQPGTVEDGNAAVTLPPSCYVTPGRFDLVIKAALSDVTHTLLRLSGLVLASSTDTMVDPSDVVPSLEELLAQIDAMETGTAAATSAATRAETAAALVDGLTVSAQQQAEISAALSTQSGHYHIAFGIPRGTDGVVGSLGSTLWSVAVSSAGDLILYYPDGASAPPLTLSADGDLIYTTD